MVPYKRGEYNLICDRCGHKIKSGKRRVEWHGLVTCGTCYDEKHPQLEKPPKIVDKYKIKHTMIPPKDTFIVFDLNWEDVKDEWQTITTNWEDTGDIGEDREALL